MTTRIRRSIADKDQGFTLIELLVVIIIIGILAAIAIPVFLNQRKKAVDAAMASDLKNAAIVVETWVADNPGTPIGWGVWVTSTVSGVDVLAGAKVSPGTWLTVGPRSPTLGAYCIYAVNNESSTPGRFRVYLSDAGGLQAGAMTGPEFAIACPTT